MASFIRTSEIEDFLTDNHQVVDDYYNSQDSPLGIEYIWDDLKDAYSRYSKLNKDGAISFDQALIEALKSATKYGTDVVEAFELLSVSADESFSTSSTQQYFREINDIYNKHNNDYDIEYCEANRDKLIEMNLKTVISIAKKYQGLGLSLDELISAGNYGLVIAYDKFDPGRSKLKNNIKDAISDCEEPIPFDVLYDRWAPFLQYGDIAQKFSEKFVPGEEYDKGDVIKWINANVSNAKFNSVATMWIKAYIMIEIDNYSRLVKKPKSEIYKDKEKYGAYKKEITVDIDAPVSADSDMVVGDVLHIEDDDQSDLEVAEACDTFKNGLNKLLTGVKARDRSIFLKKFGIGLPRPMKPKEIADQEGLSIARISQIFQTVIEQMTRNAVKYNIDPDILFDAVRKIN